MLWLPVDHAASFQEYLDKLSPIVEEVQEKAADLGMALMFPSDDAETAERNRKLSEGTQLSKFAGVGSGTRTPDGQEK